MCGETCTDSAVQTAITWAGVAMALRREVSLYAPSILPKKYEHVSLFVAISARELNTHSVLLSEGFSAVHYHVHGPRGFGLQSSRVGVLILGTKYCPL